MTSRRSIIAAILVTALAVATRAPAGTPSRVPVVASFSILGDLVANVGGDHVAITTLVGPDGDAHAFQPSPSDAKAVAAARLVFVNGLGLEGWMPRLVKAAGGSATIIETAAGIAPRTMAEDGRTIDDPHVWQSIANARIVGAHVRDGLVEADPANAAAYLANASSYLAELDALDGEVRKAIASIPDLRRRIITSHDAFGYFGAAYGMEFIAPQGVSTETEASAKDVAAIIRQIKQDKIPAIFMENISDPRLIEQIARETGTRIGGTLYSDALSRPGEGAGTYIEMMRHNIREFVGALAS